MKDFGMMVKRSAAAGLTTLNQLRVFLWLGRQAAGTAWTARQVADGTGVTPMQVSGIFKALECLEHATIEVEVIWSKGGRRSSLVARLTDHGTGWLEMINAEVAA